MGRSGHQRSTTAPWHRVPVACLLVLDYRSGHHGGVVVDRGSWRALRGPLEGRLRLVAARVGDLQRRGGLGLARVSLGRGIRGGIRRPSAVGSLSCARKRAGCAIRSTGPDQRTACPPRRRGSSGAPSPQQAPSLAAAGALPTPAPPTTATPAATPAPASIPRWEALRGGLLAFLVVMAIILVTMAVIVVVMIAPFVGF
jgi:hypothetical protein